MRSQKPPDRGLGDETRHDDLVGERRVHRLGLFAGRRLEFIERPDCKYSNGEDTSVLHGNGFRTWGSVVHGKDRPAQEDFVGNLLCECGSHYGHGQLKTGYAREWN